MARGQNEGFRKQVGQGRPVGSKNRVVQDLREMVKMALDETGGVAYLVRQSNENPAAFMALIGKIIPKEVTAKMDGNIQIVFMPEDVDI